MREALGHAEGLGDRERSVGAPHGQAAGVARLLGDELGGDRAAELAVQAGERRDRAWRPTLSTLQTKSVRTPLRAVALERARELERVGEVAVAGRVRRGLRRRRRGRASRRRARRSETSCGASSHVRCRATASASASCVAKLVISVTSTPSAPRSASLRSRKREVAPVEHRRERLDLRAEAGRHAAREHDGGDLAARDRARGPSSGCALARPSRWQSEHRHVLVRPPRSAPDAVQRLEVGSRRDEARAQLLEGHAVEAEALEQCRELRRDRRAADLHQPP